MADKQTIEYKHIKCTKEDCCLYCGSIYCGYVDDIENLEKAYKAKEQECEILKSQRDSWMSKYEQETKIKEFHQNELDQLSKQAKYEFDETLVQYSNTIEDLLKVQYQLADNCKKYNQALTEIKEIAEPFCNACQEFEPEKKGRNCMYCNYGKILHKISEVIDE
jgi:DNA repair exonuclease SbcCD ATPase subunit